MNFLIFSSFNFLEFLYCRSGIGLVMVDFLEHFTSTEVGRKCTISIRDVMSWTDFVNKVNLCFLCLGKKCLMKKNVYFYKCFLCLDKICLIKKKCLFKNV